MVRALAAALVLTAVAGTTKDFGQVAQFQQDENCQSPAGGSPQYCATVLK